MQIYENFRCDREREIGAKIHMIGVVRRVPKILSMTIEEISNCLNVPLRDCKLILKISEEHPEMSNEEVWRHFKGYKDGALDMEVKIMKICGNLADSEWTMREMLRVFRDSEFREKICKEQGIESW